MFGGIEAHYLISTARERGLISSTQCTHELVLAIGAHNRLDAFRAHLASDDT